MLTCKELIEPRSLSFEARAVTKNLLQQPGLSFEEACTVVAEEDEKWQKPIEAKQRQTGGLASLPPIVAGREQTVLAMKHLLKDPVRFSIGLRGLGVPDNATSYEINAISDDSKEITLIDEDSKRKVTISMDDFFELKPQTIQYAGSAE